MRYHTILFDADDTLFNYTQAERYALTKALGEAGIAPSDEWIQRYRIINQQLWNEYEKGRISQRELRLERFERLFAGQSPSIPLDAAAFSEMYVNYLGEGSFLTEGAEELCRSLLAAGLRLAIITNGIRAVQLKRIGRSALADAFAHIIVSEEVGFQKPHKGIFDAAFDKLALRSRDGVLMVGDALTSDMQGGADYGIDTCWFNPHGKVNFANATPTYEIKHLSELLAIIAVTER